MDAKRKYFIATIAPSELLTIIFSQTRLIFNLLEKT